MAGGVGRGRWQDLALGMVRAPVLYMIAAALLVNTLRIQLPAPVMQSLHYLANGMIPVALITLGVQLGRTRGLADLKLLSAASIARLIVSPLVAWGLAWAWDRLAPVPLGPVAPILIASLGLPIAVNVYILSIEYHKDADLASQAIFWSTLLSAVTLTGWLLILR